MNRIFKCHVLRCSETNGSLVLGLYFTFFNVKSLFKMLCRPRLGLIPAWETAHVFFLYVQSSLKHDWIL